MTELFVDNKSDSNKWSWKKFLSGPFNGTNYAKAIVLLICQLVVISLVTCVVLVIKEHWFKKQAPIPDTNTISGQTVSQQIDKSQRTVNETHLPFSGPIINFGSNEKTKTD